ncbi:MAG: ABC transporter permease [Clostridia bacterium]|nr:ABC transporter permease [Clostridia bacterium]
METGNLTIISLIKIGILIIPILILNKYFRIKLNKKIFYAFSRMIIQLTLVGIFLQYIFDLDSPLINTLYLLFMMTVASFSAINKCSLDWKKYVLPILLAFFLPNIVMIFYFNKFVVNLNNVFDTQYFIPIAGMLLGNSLSGIIIGVNNFYSSIKENEKKYFYVLSISANKLEALRPYFRQAILVSNNPTLASIETMGLVALPGMMTGQILGGVVPIVAIKYQIAIMIAVFIVRYFSLILAIFLTGYKAFDEYDVLIE